MMKKEPSSLGPEKFAKMLAMTEGVTTPIAELEAAGRADMERNQQAMREACAAFAPGATITCRRNDVGDGTGQRRPRDARRPAHERAARNARYLSAIGLHAGGMTVAQAEKMFQEQAYADIGTARQQAARGTYDPAYLNYTMGKLMIRRLRTDWTAIRGGRTAWRMFHDEFLSHGGPPIPMLRQQMTGAGGTLF